MNDERCAICRLPIVPTGGPGEIPVVHGVHLVEFTTEDIYICDSCKEDHDGKRYVRILVRCKEALDIQGKEANTCA